MSDIPILHTFILVTDGHLIGPFFTEEDAEAWAAKAGRAFKQIDRLEHPSAFLCESQQDARLVAHKEGDCLY